MATDPTSSSDALGNQPEVTADLVPINRVVKNAEQAKAICDGMFEDARDLIKNAAMVTAKVDGQRPRSPAELTRQQKGWMTNFSTRFLASLLTEVVPRYTEPTVKAKYLTAAELPQLKEDGTPWPNGPAKSEYFRQELSAMIRGWPKFDIFVHALAREIVHYGFGFAVWGDDEFEWRPTLKRMDKAAVPKGTEVTDDPKFFCYKMDYPPNELLRLASEAKKAGVSFWRDEVVVKAINESKPQSVESGDLAARDYVEMVREASWAWTYQKGYRVIKAKHLFATEITGTVSHYILWDDIPNGEESILYWKEDAFASMRDVVIPVLFDYGDGTIHGVWGGGQLLYDLSVEVEKVRNNSVDNCINSNRVKVQVAEGKDVTQVKLAVQDQIMVVAGGVYAGSQAGIGQNPEGYAQLDQRLTALAKATIGSYVPPIPVGVNTDIKAAQINSQLAKEAEVNNNRLAFWLRQLGFWIWVIGRRALRPDTPDKAGQALRQRLSLKLTDEEIVLLVDQQPFKTIIEFTDVPAQRRSQFAASVLGNQLFNQKVAARIYAEGVDGPKFAQEIVMEGDDETQTVQAQQKQVLEASAMMQGLQVPVAANDLHVVHMEVLRPLMDQGLQGQLPLPVLSNGLLHYTAHFQAATVAKGLDDVASNEAKGYIAAYEKALTDRATQEQAAVQAQQLAQTGNVVPMPDQMTQLQ